MALDFRALLKAERAKTRVKPAEQSGTAPPGGGPTTDAPVAESPALQFRLPQTDSRPQLSAAHRVHAAPPAIWHMAEWVSAGEEAALLRCADLSPPHRWTQLRGRRLQNLGGQPRPPPEGFAPEPLPGWVGAVCDALVRAGVFPPDAPPNHVLLNEYRPGEGIAAHRDGPLYAPRVAIVSLGAACTFDFVADDEARKVRASLLLPPRGVLVFSGEAYESLLHTMHVHAAPEIVSEIVPEPSADRPCRIRLDALAPSCTPSSTPAHAPSSGAGPADADAALRGGGRETFLRAVHQRALDSTAAAAPPPPPLLPPPSTPTPPMPPALPIPTLPPQPPRSRRVSLTVRRVISVQDQGTRTVQEAL